MSDTGDKFQSSNLSVPTSRVESWRKLAYQMQPSRGPGSGGGLSTKPNASPQVAGAQWLRKIEFSVYQPVGNAPQQKGGASGGGDFPGATGSSKTGRDLSNLRINFHIKHQQAGQPATLWARIYNMAPKTMQEVIQYGRVKVMAGYHFSGYGLIFDGSVVQYRRGKENPTDTYLEIHAGDGDDRINYGIFLKEYPANTSDAKILEDAVKELGYKPDESYIQKELMKEMEKSLTQRANTKMGMVRDQLRELMQKYNANFYFQHGKIYIQKNGDTLKGKAVVLSPKTGLVGLPEVTPQGIQCQCLLNPKIYVGSRVKIDASVLSGVPFTPGSNVKVTGDNIQEGQGMGAGSGAPGNAGAGGPGTSGGIKKSVALWGGQLETAFTSPQGDYKVIMLEHQGDTRGDPWFCNMICVALDDKGKVIVGSNQSSVWYRASPAAVGG